MWLMICTTFRMVQAQILTMAAPGRQQQQLLDACALDGLRNGECEVTAQEAHGFALYVLGELAVARLGQRQLVVAQEARRMGGVRQVQAVPVDYRAAGENELNRLQVVKGKLIQTLEPTTKRQRRNALGRTRRLAFGSGQCCVVVASPAWGRRSERVPKKMPRVTPRTSN
ncbi:MAG: hypothetical protein QM756_10400 [Polyangiaceae bacterium]